MKWLGAWWGRVAAALGVLVTGIDTIDIGEIQGPLSELIGHRWVVRITVALFILSYIRHQQVANKVRELKQTIANGKADDSHPDSARNLS